MTPALIKQPENSALCGQCCVAMAAAARLSAAIDAMGDTPRGTTTADVVHGLRALGINCADRLKRTSKNRVLPPRCIITMEWSRRCGHWMLYWDGHLLDPGDRYPEGYDSHCRIVSYLEIFE